MIEIYCIETGIKYYYSAETPYEAMTDMLYTLNLSSVDVYAQINLSANKNFLWMQHNDKTYVCSLNVR